jgi:hypothetical protein
LRQAAVYTGARDGSESNKEDNDLEPTENTRAKAEFAGLLRRFRKSAARIIAAGWAGHWRSKRRPAKSG